MISAAELNCILIKYKKQLNKIEGRSRDGSAKKYTNKICRDNVSHPLYIPALAFLDNLYHTLLIQYVKYR